MEVKFKVQNKDNNYKRVLSFLSNPQREVLYNNVLNSFELEKHKCSDLQNKDTLVYVGTKVAKITTKKQSLMDEMAIHYQEQWNSINNTIQNIFEEIFTPSSKNQKLTAYIWPCCVAPYGDNCFYVCANENKLDWPNTLTTCLHELTHQFWWKEWNKIYPNQKSNSFGDDNMAWLLSEFAVDSIICTSELKNYINKRPAYNRFYPLMIDDKNVIEYFREIKQATNIDDFMKESYSYVLENKNIFNNYLYKAPTENNYISTKNMFPKENNL